MVIKNGNVHDGLGNVTKGIDILIENGKIAKIGKNLPHGDGEDQMIDATDKEVLPGFIDMLTTNGAWGPAMRDTDLCEHTNPITPEMNVVYAFTSDGMNFQEMYRYGTTTVGVTPTVGNVLGGIGGVFKTYGTNSYEMLRRGEAFSVASVTVETKKVYGEQKLSPMTKMGGFSLLIEALKKAERYEKTGGNRELDMKCEALLPVLHGKRPLMVNCSTKSEINGVSHALGQFKKMKLVLTGAFEIDEDMGVLRGKPQIVMGDLTNALLRVNANVDFGAIKKIVDRGIDVAISCCGDQIANGKESLLWNGILWHKNGFESEQVIKMLTSIPAKILGVNDTVGSIEVGKAADIAIWSQNPVENYGARLEAILLGGVDLIEAERYATCW